MYKYMKIDIDDESQLQKMINADLYNLQHEAERLLKDIYEEECRRKLLTKYSICCTQKVLGTNTIYVTHGNSRGGNTDGYC